MDVKGDNTLFDNSGAWFLGDFGSACLVGDTIRTSIPTFYHGAMDDKVMREAERAMSDKSYPPEQQSVIIEGRLRSMREKYHTLIT